jgi:hypothetical protein
MTMLLLFVLVMAISGFWYVKHVGRTSAGTSQQERLQVQPFASVEVRCDNSACSSVKNLVGQKLLAEKAPMLPLPQCDAESCRCRYQKIADRREDSRRSIDFGIEPRIYDGTERRDRNDRRSG